MIRFMLTRMEKSPSAVFYEKQLKASFLDDFERAKQERLLQRIPAPVDGASYSFGLSRPYTVVSMGDGTFEAFDDEDPEVDPIPLKASDLVQWRLDLGALGATIQMANGLQGKPELLTDRLYFLGETDQGGARTAFVLGLFHNSKLARAQLAQLPGLLRRYSSLVVACPTFAPTLADQHWLEPLKIAIVSLGEGEPFHLGHPTGTDAASPSPQPAQKEAAGGVFRKEGEYWTLQYRGSPFKLRHVKGLAYVAFLLRHPSQEVHVMRLVLVSSDGAEIAPAITGRATAAQAAEAGLSLSPRDDLGPLLDEEAKGQYQGRLEQLREEIAEAERDNDIERTAKLSQERDFLLQYLSAALGLKGKDRKVGSPTEKARIGVTNRIKAVIEKIAKEDPPFADFLKTHIRTGTFCSYTSDFPFSYNI